MKEKKDGGSEEDAILFGYQTQQKIVQGTAWVELFSFINAL